MNKINNLLEFQNKISKALEPSVIENEFAAIADYLLNTCNLIAGDKCYRITEIEFYYFVPNVHEDLYAHKAKEQLSCGRWYDHDFGIDLTIGNMDKGIYGGILLRGLYNMSNSIYLNGPLILRHELIFNLGTIFNPKPFMHLIDVPKRNNTITSCKRILRKRREGDTLNFMEKPFRYLTDLEENKKRKK